MLSKALETSVFFHRGPVLGNTILSQGLREKDDIFYQENFHWRIREAHKRKIGKRATLSIGAPLGNVKGVLFIGHSSVTNGGVWKRSTSLCGSSVRGTARGDSFTGDPEVKEGSGNRHLSL